MSEKLITEVTDLVKRLAAHQAALGLRNKQFAARYKDWLKSESTWIRLIQGKWVGVLNHDRIAASLRDLAARLESARGFDDESFLRELPFVTLLNAQWERLLGSKGDRRGLVVLAPEGCGKSWWASSVTKRDSTEEVSLNATAFYLRIRSTWKDKKLHLLQGMAVVLGAPMQKTPSLQHHSLVDHMRALGDVTVILDEAHNGGVELFKLLKDLIDETPARFVYLAFPTQYDEVRSKNTGAIAEARQFLRRCLRPVFDDYRNGISAEDVSAYLRARGLTDAGMAAFAASMAPRLAVNYNLSTLADAADEAQAEAEEDDRKPTLENVRQAVEQLISTASERRNGVKKTN